MGGDHFEEIRERVDRCARSIDAPEHYLPTYGHSEDAARPHVEVDGPVMQYVVVERGQELSRETFADVDGLLARIFKDVTFQMASHFELRNRRPNEDARRVLFAKQLELLGRLSPDWAEQQRATLNRVLLEYPFTDFHPERGV